MFAKKVGGAVTYAAQCVRHSLCTWSVVVAVVLRCPMTEKPASTIIGLDRKRRTVAIWASATTLAAGFGVHVLTNLEAVPIVLGMAVALLSLAAYGLRTVSVVPTETEITALECTDEELIIRYGLLAPPIHVQWADVRHCDLRTAKPSRMDSVDKQPGLTVTYRNRKAKVLFAKALFVPGRPWFLEAVEAFLTRPTVNWRLNGLPCADESVLREAATSLHVRHQSRDSHLGLRAKATELMQ